MHRWFDEAHRHDVHDLPRFPSPALRRGAGARASAVTMRAHFDGVAAVKAAVGRDLGTTGWLTMTQDRVNAFADATGDHQWIHVDPARAARGPFGACIAHGYLTQSLASLFLAQLVSYDHLRMGVNDGCDRVRFPAPVKVGARIRGRAEVIAATDLPHEGVQATIRVIVEIEGGSKPACIVDTVTRLYFEREARRAAVGRRPAVPSADVGC